MARQKKTKTEETAETSDRTPQTAVGGVTPSLILKTAKSCNTIETALATARGDKAAVMERFKDAGGQKGSFKTAMKINNLEADVGKDFLLCQLEYLKVLGFISDFKITFAQGEMFDGEDVGNTGKAADGDEDGEGAEPREDIGQAQAGAFQDAHGAH